MFQRLEYGQIFGGEHHLAHYRGINVKMRRRLYTIQCKILKSTLLFWGEDS